MGCEGLETAALCQSARCTRNKLRTSLTLGELCWMVRYCRNHSSI